MMKCLIKKKYYINIMKKEQPTAPPIESIYPDLPTVNSMDLKTELNDSAQSFRLKSFNNYELEKIRMFTPEFNPLARLSPRLPRYQREHGRLLWQYISHWW